MIMQTVEATIEKFKLLDKNDRVIVGISGGPDSVALVYLLNKLKKKWKLHLHLAHLNHMIRKNEADQDSLFVENLAKRLGLELTQAKVDVKDFAKKNKLSLEDAARRIRYKFFLKTARANQASKIALGHNRDDQAETVLMRFLRGSGISGLRGMPVVREFNGCFIVRPLSEVTRKQIINFLNRKKISYCTDSSNLENFYFRNRIRNKLLPSLEKNFNSNIKEILVNFAENIGDDVNYLEKEGIKKFKAVRKSFDDSQIILDTKKFFALDKALQKLVARKAIKELKTDLRRIDYKHWKEIENLMETRPKDSIVDLPGGISVVKKAAKLVFYKRK